MIKLWYASEPTGVLKEVFENVEYKKAITIPECDYILISRQHTTNNHIDNVRWLNQVIDFSKKNNRPYIAFLHDDPDKVMNIGTGLLFRTSFLKSKSGGAICYPSFSFPIDEQLTPNENFKIGFCGNGIAGIRKQSIEKIRFLKNEVIIRSRFHLHFSQPEIIQHEIDFYNNMKNCSYQLCMRGGGNFSHRFYQTMMYGRIPIIIDTDYPLPCSDVVKWDEYIVIARNVNELCNAILSWDAKHDLIESQNNARRIWEQYLSAKGFGNYLNRLLKPLV